MTSEVKLFDNQVSGKTAKFTDVDRKIIYKELSAREVQFYEFINTRQIQQGQYRLKNFVPKYLGIKGLTTVNIAANPEDISRMGQWMSHMSERNRNSDVDLKQYIKLQNLSSDYKLPCVMDVKLGKKKISKKSNKKFEQSTTNSHNFRINGMSNHYVEQNEPHFISKYYFQKTPEEEIEAHLAFFFFNGNQIDISLVKNCIEQIKNIVFSLLTFRTGYFDSASLLILYDAFNHSKFTVKIIDFDKYYPQTKQILEGDQNIIIGLKYIIGYLNNILSNHEPHEQQIKARKLKLFETFEVIPQQKVSQFQKSPSSSGDKREQKLQKQVEYFNLVQEAQPS